MRECEQTLCWAIKAEKCGGPGRLLTYVLVLIRLSLSWLHELAESLTRTIQL
eukprot:SAG25_NODE_1281_length_3418_cov_39.866526_3_plen_52_part_00